MFSQFHYFLFCSQLFSKFLVSVVQGLLAFLTNSLYLDFLMSSFFTASLSLFKSTGTVSNPTTSNLSTLLFKFLKLLK